MEINQSTEIWVHIREPFNKNSLWIQPIDGVINIKVFDKGWKIIATTKDLGLSENALKQVITLVNELDLKTLERLKKFSGKYSNNMVNLLENEKKLEKRLSDLESKFDKLTKRYAKSLVKLD